MTDAGMQTPTLSTDRSVTRRDDKIRRRAKGASSTRSALQTLRVSTFLALRKARFHQVPVNFGARFP